MPGNKKSERTLQREQGLERTDNELPLTSWPEPNPINQKNYYTEYIKRDDQILPLRLIQEERRARLAAQHKERDRARNIDTSMVEPDEMDEDAEEDAAGGQYDQEFASGDDVVVIHPGSQKLTCPRPHDEDRGDGSPPLLRQERVRVHGSASRWVGDLGVSTTISLHL